jgi:hypothetical protein
LAANRFLWLDSYEWSVTLTRSALAPWLAALRLRFHASRGRRAPARWRRGRHGRRAAPCPCAKELGSGVVVLQMNSLTNNQER